MASFESLVFDQFAFIKSSCKTMAKINPAVKKFKKVKNKNGFMF